MTILALENLQFLCYNAKVFAIQSAKCAKFTQLNQIYSTQSHTQRNHSETQIFLLDYLFYHALLDFAAL